MQQVGVIKEGKALKCELSVRKRSKDYFDELMMGKIRYRIVS